MEARALSPRAVRSCSVKNPEGKEKSDCQPNTNWPNSFQILKSARASVAARALVHLSLRHQTPQNQRRLSLSLSSSLRSHYLPQIVRSPGTPGTLSCCVIVVICSKSRSLKSDFHKAPLIRSCSKDKLPQRLFGEPYI